jgi:hypothetical protein
MSKIFQPHTRQQDERQIVRSQKDFTAGMFADITSTQIPDNGIAYLKDIKNLGYALEGRTGCKEWGDRENETACASLPFTYLSNISGIVSSFTTTNRGYLRNIHSISSDLDNTTYLAAYDIELVGKKLIFDDNTSEEIISLDNGVAQTFTLTNTTKILSNGKITKENINGFYFHKLQKKIVLVLGKNIYIARDINISTWDLSYPDTTTDWNNTQVSLLKDSKCSFDEINNNVIIFNKNGIFSLDLSQHNIQNNYITSYYKINTDVPTQPLYEQTGDVGTYKRRYIYSLSKINDNGAYTSNLPSLGSGLLTNRQVIGSSLILDSGGNLVDRNYKDYVEYSCSGEPSNDNPILVSGFQSTDPQWDYFTLWGTSDISDAALDPVSGFGNNSEAYSWIDDIPICKAFKIDVSGTNVYMNGYSNQQPFFSIKDSANTVNIYTSSSGFIHSYFSVVIGADDDGYENAALLTKTTTTGNDDITITENIGTTVGFINAGSGALVTINGHVVSPILGNSFLNTDNGKRLFLSNGKKYHITGVSGISGLIAENDNISTTIAACWAPEEGFNKIYQNNSWIDGGRLYSDITSDDKQKSRLTGFPFYQRLYQNLDNSNIGLCIPGWLITANNQKLSYSQVADGYEYLTGYYHPQYQIANTKDNIKAFGKFIDKLVIYCSNSTYFIPTNVTATVNLNTIGVDITTLSSLNIIDSNIGILNSNSLCDVEQNKQILITNESTIRMFDGNQYSESLSVNKINSLLNKFSTNISALYNPYIGYMFWGSIE